MSDESVVETEGITVTKSFDAEGFPVPAVTFQVESDRSDPIGLRITDEIPDGFGIEQIGFHPDYGSENWTATGEGVVRFERTVDPGEAFTTVYGIRMADDDEPEPFLESPTVEVDPDAIEEEQIDDVVPKESSEVVRELASGERDTVPGLEEEAEAVGDAAEAESTPQTGAEALADDDAEIIGEPDETAAEGGADSEEGEPTTAESPEDELGAPTETGADVIGGAEESVEAGTEADDDRPEEPDEPDEPLAETEATAESDDAAEAEAEPEADEPEIAEEATEPEAKAEDVEAAEAAAGGSGGAALDAESIAAAFAAEIESGNVDDEDLEVIRTAVVEESPSDRVRIEHLQSRVSDLEAYTDALESFIDENGEAQELLDELESEIDAFREDFGDLEGRLDSATDVHDALAERIDDVAEDLDAVEEIDEQLDRLHGDLEALDERVDDTEAVRFDVEDLEEDVESLREEVNEVKQWREQLSSVFGGAE